MGLISSVGSCGTLDPDNVFAGFAVLNQNALSYKRAIISRPLHGSAPNTTRATKMVT